MLKLKSITKISIKIKIIIINNSVGIQFNCFGKRFPLPFINRYIETFIPT